MGKTSANPEKDGKNKFRSFLIEWAVIITVFGFLYIMGWHTEVIGKVQQAILWTGIMQPNTELPVDQKRIADLNMSMSDMDGEPVNLNEFEGNVIFLNFWATWCAPCIAEMPNIQNLYQETKDWEGLKFVMVSLDESIEKAASFISRKEYSFPVYYLSGYRPPSLRSSVVPTTYVIDRNGQILAEREGMAHYNNNSFKEFLREAVGNSVQNK